jgi:hypothetical protein
MSSPFPPRATSSLNLPEHQLLAPPVLPSLGDCFPCGSVDLGKYFLYSSALSRRARWRTSLVMSLGGAGLSSFGIGYVADDNVDTSDFQPKEKKTRTQRYIYAWRDTEDGPLEIILPQESLWYRFYVRNYYINEDVKLQKAFHLHFRLPYKQYLELVQQVPSCLIDGVGQSQTIRRCPRLSCLSLVHCVISVVGGPLMTVKSPLRLTVRSIVVFFRFL